MTAHDEVDRIGRVAGAPLRLRIQEADAEGPPDLGDEGILHRGDPAAGAVEPVGPEGGAGLGVGELDGEAHLLGAVAQAALHDIAHAEFAADRPGLDRPPLVGLGRGLRDDEGAGGPGEVGGQVLGDLLGEVILLRVAGLVGERQDDEGQARPRRIGRGDPRHARRRDLLAPRREMEPGQGPGKGDAGEEQGGEDGAQEPVLRRAASGEGTA